MKAENSAGGAHPRSRGENLTSYAAIIVACGSSPLTRGKREESHLTHGRVRLIPAHAGKTPGRLFRRGHVQGSSPLTRGKRARQAPRRRRQGLIPAHAGKTSRRRGDGLHGPAHPRSRGENADRSSPTSGGTGSSPLTRGKPAWCFGVCGVRGLIPAHAGKTKRWRPVTRPTRAHPRSRGENGRRSLVSVKVKGSSPLTRGKRHHGVDRGLDEGLIPAHAGKT